MTLKRKQELVKDAIALWNNRRKEAIDNKQNEVARACGYYVSEWLQIAFKLGIKDVL